MSFILLDSSTAASGGGAVTLQTADKRCTLRLRAFPLPLSVTELLDQSTDLLRSLDRSSDTLAEEALKQKAELKTRLEELFEPELERLGLDKEVVERIWSFGPRKSGPNLLVNEIPCYQRRSVWGNNTKTPQQDSTIGKRLVDFDSSVIGGFQVY